MRYCFLLFILVATTSASAQIFVNKTDVNLRPVQYIEVWEKYTKGDNNTVFAMLDYGQQDDLNDREGKMLHVTNKDGQYLEFNSMVDVLNFMFRNGWEVLHSKTTAKVQSYILKKRKDFVAKPAKMMENKTSTMNKMNKASTLNKVEKVVSDKKNKAVQSVKKASSKKVTKPVPAVKTSRLPK